MKTIFETKTFSERSLWMGAVPGPLPTIDKDARDAIILKVTPAIVKARELDDLVNWSHDHDPYLKNFFGDDQGAFWMGWGQVHKFRPIMDALVSRMLKDDPSAWTELSDDEQSVVDFWPEAVNAIYEIYQEHYAALPTSQKPGPAAPAATPPPPLVQTKKSLVSENVLIGGAIVIGLGIFVYAIT